MKTIDIPNDRLIPNQKAFNCSIVEAYGKVFLLYRFEKPYGDYNTSIAISELDHNFYPIQGTSKVIDPVRWGGKVRTYDDPRAFVHNGDLYFMYCSGMLVPIEGGFRWGSHLALARYGREEMINGQWLPDYAKNLNISNGKGKQLLQEKNWTPFCHKGKIRFAYTINPLKIIEMDLGSTMSVLPCKEVSTTQFTDKFWVPKHGEFLGGGTPLHPVGEEYVGFFHSYKDDKSGKPNCRTYNFGFFAISKEEPHRVTRMSKVPIMTAKLDEKRDLRGPSPWKPNCVYPCGWIERNGKVYVSAGWQDCRCELIELTWAEIEKNVIEVKQKR